MSDTSTDLLNTTGYGVLVTGFSRMRLPEIRNNIVTSLNTRLNRTFETRPDSITGQFINTFAEREAALWELAEAVYHAMYPISAFGTNLDHAVSFAGVKRLFAESSNAWVTLTGQEQIIISAGSIVRNENTQDEFSVRHDVTISRQNAVDITFSVNDAIEGNAYWVKINSVLYSYNCAPGDATLDIAAQLGVLLLASGFEQSIDANILRLWTIESVPFTAEISTNITMQKVGSPGFVDAVNTGPVDVSANSITQIVTLRNGWDSVNNITPGYFGRDLETDDELRLRYDTGVFRLGAATLPAIKANLEQSITGVLSVEVFENYTDDVDSEGRKPHSIEVVAYGGDPQEIGNAIFNLKAAGIDTNGDIHVVVTDSVGYNHDVYFNRPTPVFFWVKAVVDLYNEEIFPDNGVLEIQTVIADTGNSFGIGKDVIVQRFYGPVYANVAGIGHMTITVASTTDANQVPADTDYAEANVPIASSEISQFDATRVQVTVNP